MGSVDKSDGIVTITLDNPRTRNALNTETWTWLLAELRAVATAPGDRVVILAGADGHFSSGADMTERPPEGQQPPPPTTTMRLIGEVISTLHHLPQPTIAKVRGDAVGGGANLALACDLIVAAEDAAFIQPFPRIALSIDAGGSWSLTRRVGLAKAKELVFFGDRVEAADAEDLGMVNRVVPGTELDAFVSDWARRLAALPPIALCQSKQLLNASFTSTMDEAVAAEGTAQSVNLRTKDFREAFKAFAEKRPPKFHGS